MMVIIEDHFTIELPVFVIERDTLKVGSIHYMNFKILCLMPLKFFLPNSVVIKNLPFKMNK